MPHRPAISTAVRRNRRGLERESIRVKNQNTEEMPIWVTRHGPLFVNENDTPMALRWIAAEPGFVQYPFLDIDRAQTWVEFRTALERLPGPASNFVYADTDGNIGYQWPADCRYGAAMRATCLWMDRPAISNGTASFRLPISHRLQPARRHHRHFQSDPFPDNYSYPVGGRLRAIPAPARCGRVCRRARAGGRKTCSASSATCIRRSASSWPGNWWRLTTTATRTSPTRGFGRHAARMERADGIRGGVPFLIALGVPARAHGAGGKPPPPVPRVSTTSR